MSWSQLPDENNLYLMMHNQGCASPMNALIYLQRYAPKISLWRKGKQFYAFATGNDWRPLSFRYLFHLVFHSRRINKEFNELFPNENIKFTVRLPRGATPVTSIAEYKSGGSYDALAATREEFKKGMSDFIIKYANSKVSHESTSQNAD